IEIDETAKYKIKNFIEEYFENNINLENLKKHDVIIRLYFDNFDLFKQHAKWNAVIVNNLIHDTVIAINQARRGIATDSTDQARRNKVKQADMSPNQNSILYSPPKTPADTIKALKALDAALNALHAGATATGRPA